MPTDTPPEHPTLRGVLSEAIGTFALVLFGAGSAVLAAGSPGPGGQLLVALAHGTVLIVFVTACMYVSGAQFNPAVSIAFVVAGRQRVPVAAVYIIVQLAAACAAAGVLAWAFADDPRIDASRLGATLGSLSDAGRAGPVFVLEAIMTFALMFVVLAAVADARAHRMGGVCVGLVVTACVVSFGSATGASLNPARSFGPAIFGHWDMHWVYWLAPIVGACAASVVYRTIFEQRPATEPEPHVPPLHEGDAIERAPIARPVSQIEPARV